MTHQTKLIDFRIGFQRVIYRKQLFSLSFRIQLKTLFTALAHQLH